jgi:ATP-dependent DNA helicase RecQ
MIVEQENVPIYMVANQATLTAIATYLPQTKKDLMLMPGFGNAKVNKYGENILEAILEYCERNNVPSNMDATPNLSERKEKAVDVNAVKKPNTKTTSFDMYKKGKTIAEIAQERNMAASTIEGHLATFVANGQLNINEFVTPEKQGRIKEVIDKLGMEAFAPIIAELGSAYTYGEVKMVAATMQNV